MPAPLITLETASNNMTSLVSRPAFLLAAAVGLSVIVFDVNNSASPHFLPHYIDQPVHAWVKANLPAPIKKLVAEKLVSDLFITGGIGGWVVAGVAGIGKSGWVGVRRLAIVLFMYVYGGVLIPHGASINSVHSSGYIRLWCRCMLSHAWQCGADFIRSSNGSHSFDTVLQSL